MCGCHSGCVGGDASGSGTVGARDVWYSVVGVDSSGRGGFVHCSGIHSALVRTRVPHEAARNIDTNGLSNGGIMMAILQAEHVGFSYEQDRMVLRDINA